MDISLPSLERERDELLLQVAGLGDLRRGSISSPTRRCGKPACYCAHPGTPGHQGNTQITYKVQGKTVTRSLPTPADRRKAEREIGEYRKFQQWSRAFVEVNEKICRLRPVEEEEEQAASLTAQEKNGRGDPTRSRPRNRTVAGGDLRRPAQESSLGSGSAGDGHASGAAPSRRKAARATAGGALGGRA